MTLKCSLLQNRERRDYFNEKTITKEILECQEILGKLHRRRKEGCCYQEIKSNWQSSLLAEPP